MLSQKDLELLDGLLKEVQSLGSHRDEVQIDRVTRRAEMILRRIFGDDAKYLTDLARIRFSPMVYPTDESSRIRSFENGKSRLQNLLQTAHEEIAIFSATEGDLTEAQQPNTSDVFVVHGHDESMKEAVSRVLEKLDLNPVILHEKPNQGRTIIEKFSDYGAVGFAIVLLSPDDEGRKIADENPLRLRARQNVIFELGYFIGRLGRHRVLALFKDSEDFEMPSDYSGVLFVPYDVGGRWKFDLVKELKQAGFAVDANRILGT